MVKTRTLTVGLVTMLMVVSITASMATPLLPILGYVLYNDLRTKPQERDTLGINPSYTAVLPVDGCPVYQCLNEKEATYEVISQGRPLGSCPRADTVIASVPRGSVLLVDPGIISRANLIGVAVMSNAVDFPVRGIRILPKSERLPKWVESKWLIPIDTSSFRHGLYAVKIKGIFRQYRSAFLGLGRKGYDAWDEKTFWFYIQDPNYWKAAANDPEVQAFLRYSSGLTGGPAMLGSAPKFEIDPSIAQQLQDGSISIIAEERARAAEEKAIADSKDSDEAKQCDPKPEVKQIEPEKVKSVKPKAEVRQAEPERVKPAAPKDEAKPKSKMRVHNGPTEYQNGDIIILDSTCQEREIQFEGDKSTSAIYLEVTRMSDGEVLIGESIPTPSHSHTLSVSRADLSRDVYKVSVWSGQEPEGEPVMTLKIRRE